MAGKGGTGKTTVAGFLIKYLVQKGKIPILAVDADSNANLNEILGVPLEATLGSVREEMKDGVVQQGMTKQMFMEMKLAEAVFEGEGFDLIAMGRPEGAGCYCAANNLLSMYLGNRRRSRVQGLPASGGFYSRPRTAFGMCIYEKNVILPNPKFGARLAITWENEHF